MNILSIGYGRTLFDAQNSERARLVACAAAVGQVHHIVFARSADGLEAQVDGSLHLYPTGARTKIGMLWNAFALGSRIAGQGGIDVVTAQDPLASGLVAWLVARRFRLPLVLQEHGDIFSGDYWRTESLSNRLWFPVARFLVRRASRIRVVSQRVVEHVMAQGVPQERIRTLPVFMDLYGMRERAIGSDLHQECPQASPIVLSVARFVKQKNLLLLVRAFAAFRKAQPNALLVLVGRGEEEQALRKEVATLGLEGAVVFKPWADDVASLMKTADIYALSSNYEGYARVLSEAMACGLPAVTTDVGCVGEVWLPGVHGRSVPVGDTDAFGAALTSLGEGPTRLQAVATGADLGAYARAWAGIFESL